MILYSKESDSMQFSPYYDRLICSLVKMSVPIYGSDAKTNRSRNRPCNMLSIVETTKKHNNSPYAAIRALF